MKKIKVFAIALVCAFSVNALAEQTAHALIKITSEYGSDEVELKEATQFSNAYDNGSEAGKIVSTSTPMNVNIYGVIGTDKYSVVATNNLVGLSIEIITNKIDDDYTLSFENVSGRALAIKDVVTGTITMIDATKTYAFTAAKGNNTIARFQIVEKPSEPAICHQYGNLIITGHQGAKVKVLDMADQVAIAEQTLATDDEVISLSSLTKGEMYKVIVDEGTPMLIRIQ